MLYNIRETIIQEAAGGWHRPNPVDLDSLDFSFYNNIRDRIRNDFQLLKRISARELWTHSTHVPRHFFSPDADIERQVILLVNDLCVKLCCRIAQNGAALRPIHWRQLEEIIAVALEGIGFDVELTPSAKDGGKDVVAKCTVKGRSFTYFTELKHWHSGSPGVRQVREFVEVNVKNNTDGGLFLSSSGFTQSVHSQLAEITSERIRLGENTKIVSLCQRFVQSQGQTLWKAEGILPTILFEHTFSHASPQRENDLAEQLGSCEKTGVRRSD